MRRPVPWSPRCGLLSINSRRCVLSRGDAVLRVGPLGSPISGKQSVECYAGESMHRKILIGVAMARKFKQSCSPTFSCEWLSQMELLRNMKDAVTASTLFREPSCCPNFYSHQAGVFLGRCRNKPLLPGMAQIVLSEWCYRLQQRNNL